MQRSKKEDNTGRNIDASMVLNESVKYSSNLLKYLIGSLTLLSTLWIKLNGSSYGLKLILKTEVNVGKIIYKYTNEFGKQWV